MIQKTKKYVKPCFLTMSLGFFLLHPFSAEFSQTASLPLHSYSVKGSTESPEALFKAREKKVLQILSNFKTGLRPQKKRALAIFINEESHRYGFDPELIIAIISTESSFYNWSTSPKGAVGLMQIIPTTGKELAETNNIVWKGEDPLLDPFVNIKLGIHYLWDLYLKFGDLSLALTAYNYGPSAVVRWLESGEEIPTKYSEKVLKRYEELLTIEVEEKIEPEKESSPGFPPV
ncbi:MAG: lytic transglycosylase domain-containing protein [Candidatus Manganitrophaceae bacterium]|nr:MAG: lytic transglycosylase domain-containing protein [Candidatus Manganitrophaceae bacterium]